MALIVIDTSKTTNARKLYGEIKKLNLSYTKLTPAQAEDLGMSIAMREVKRGDTVSMKTLLKTLRK